jgi:Na+-driven multidrug efflux pump
VALVNVPLSTMLCRGVAVLGYSGMGFVGISTGTAICHVMAGFAVLAVLAVGRSGLKLKPRLFALDASVIRRILSISVPAGFDSLSVSLYQFWFLSIVNGLGKEAAAAHGIALRWESLGYLSGGAFHAAAMALVGQYLGARDPRQASRSAWTAFGLGCAVMCAMGATFYLLADPMFRLYCPYENQQGVVVMGVQVLRLVAFAMPALASCIIFTGALRGGGDTLLPVSITWVGFLVFRIPLAYWLTSADGANWGLYGAWVAMFVDLWVRGLALLWRFVGGQWQRIRV